MILERPVVAQQALAEEKEETKTFRTDRSKKPVYVYRVVEDGSDFCVKAETMMDAVRICQEAYLNELTEDDSEGSRELDIEYYNRRVLESCQLVGELRN